MRARAGARAVLALAAALLWSPAARADVVHTVARGDTLAGLSERYYGTIANEAVIVAANFMYVQQVPAVVPGIHLVIPSVSYYRAVAGDTWERIAQRLLGEQRRGAYLARVNNAPANVPPSPDTILRVPYLLRYVVTSEEPLFEVARRFYGDRSLVQFIVEFNLLPSQRLARGQVLILPLPDLVLREDVRTEDAPLVEAHAAQQHVVEEIPALQRLLHRGAYLEAVSLGTRLAAEGGLSVAQRVALDRCLAEAYVALDRRDLAAQALRDALAADPALSLDPLATPPKVLDALSLARGAGPTRATAPPPPTSRPDGAH